MYPLRLLRCSQDRIGEYRKKELAKLRTQERYIAGNRFSFFSIPIITALATFISYSLLGGEMSAEKVRASSSSDAQSFQEPVQSGNCDH